MTVQPLEMPTIDLGLDIATLVGEMEAVPCDSRSHYRHVDEPASHYARATCPCCTFDHIRAYCPTMMEAIANDGLIQCQQCHIMTRASASITILGPIGGTK
jgi:hypothetical protein